MQHPRFDTKESSYMAIIPCSVTGCPNQSKAKGLCGTHYDRKRNTGDPGSAELRRPQKLDLNAVCKIDGCLKKVKSKNLCNAHYKKQWRHGNPLYQRTIGSGCSVEDCQRKYFALGVCKFHRAKQTYEQNKDRKNQLLKIRRATNPDKFRNYYNTYRARQMTNAYVFTPKDLQRLSRLACAYCGATENLELEHIIPLARGGCHSVGNTTKACRSCNSSKSDRLLMEWRLDKKSPRYKN